MKGFVFYVFLIGVSQIFGQKVCNKLHMSSSFGPDSTYDIIRDGVVANTWNSDALDSPVISVSKSLEYFYLPDLDVELDQSNIRLYYDDPQHVVSEAILKREKKGWYTIEVYYKCDSYGGNFINYELEIQVPNCGRATVNWRKLCGNPYTEREGLSVNLLFAHHRQTIVRNGKLYNAGYFDRDINSNAILLPARVHRAQLEIFINPSDIQKGIDSTVVRSFQSSLPNTETEKKFSPATFISRVRADSDQNIVNVKVEGELGHAGVVISDASRATVDLIFECTELGGDSTVEVDILLPVFKDVTIYFVKHCPVGLASGWTYLKYLFILAIVAAAFVGITQQQSLNLNLKKYKPLNWNWTKIRRSLSDKFEECYLIAAAALSSHNNNHDNFMEISREEEDTSDYELKGLKISNEKDEENIVPLNNAQQQDYPISRTSKNTYGTI